MLRFKQYTILMEDNAKEVAAKYPHIAHVNTRVLSSFGHRLGKITSPVMDRDKINDIATEFHKHRDALKATGEHDINKHNSLDSMEASVAKLKAKKAAKEDVEILHHDPKTGVTIKHVRTKEACQKGYGGGKTNWCTAASGSGNLFNSYGESGKKMITIHHKLNYNAETGEHSGETVHGVHEHEGGTIRDAENNETDHQRGDLRQARRSRQIHPDISKAMAKTPELTKTNLVSKNPHFEPTHEHIDSAMKDPDSSAAISMLSSYKDKIKPHHIDAAMSHPDGRVAATALREHKDKITTKHIDAAMKHPDGDVAATALREHKDKITQEHIDAAMSHPNSGVASAVLRVHKDKITTKHIDAAMSHPNPFVVASAALRVHKDKITTKHIDAAMSHPDGRIADIAMEHHGDKITPKHHAILHKKIMDSITNDDVGTAKETMRSHKEHITQEHVDAAFSRKPQDDDGDANHSLMTHVMRDHTKMGVNYINRIHAAKTGDKD